MRAGWMRRLYHRRAEMMGCEGGGPQRLQHNSNQGMI